MAKSCDGYQSRSVTRAKKPPGFPSGTAQGRFADAQFFDSYFRRMPKSDSRPLSDRSHAVEARRVEAVAHAGRSWLLAWEAMAVILPLV